MTAITKLHCKGFKSFAKKTEVLLLPGFNCVIGPNGNGKSNVVDAICFVLGKSSAKGLRAEKSANLIYNGGKKGRPAKEAEVSIFFDNKNKVFPFDEKEIKFTRIVKQSGSSVYKINDKKMTRTQIIDILRIARIDPDGHNIVLQGDIVHFMSMKSTERREIIEDVAGISIFEDKKNKSMNELNRVQERLNEAEIILHEREKTLKDLKKDRDQALQFKDLEVNIQRNKATRVHLKLKDKREQLDAVLKRHTDYDAHVKKVQDEIDALKKEVQEKKTEIRAINIELNEKGDKKQRELAKEIEKLKTSIIQDTSRRDVVDNELKKLKERNKSLNNEQKELTTKIVSFKSTQEKRKTENITLTEKQEKTQKRIRDYKEKHGILDKDDISQKIEQLDNKIENNQRNISDNEEKKLSSIRAKDKCEYELESIEKNLDKIRVLKKEGENKLIDLKNNRNEFKRATKRLSECLNQSSVYSTQLSSARSKLMDANDEFAKMRTRSIGIREMSAGGHAIKKITSMGITGVFGTVGELGQVSSEYALSLEIAAGPRMKSVVVSSDQVAAKCIKILKESKSGVVTFLPLNKLRERKINPEERKLANADGAHGLAIDLVKYEPKFATVFKYVFAGTLIVDNLSTARRLGVGRARMVTLEGDLIESSGAMVGGYRRRGSSGLGFQQKEVSHSIKVLEKDIERLNQTVNLLQDKKTKNEEEIIQLRESKAVLEAKIKAAEVQMGGIGDTKELNENKKIFKEKLREHANHIKHIDNEIKEERSKLNEFKKQKQAQMNKLSKLTSSVVTKDLEAFDEQKQQFKEKIIKNTSEIHSLNSQIDLYQSEVEKTISILKNNEKENGSFFNERKGLLQDLDGNKDILKIKEANQRKFYAEYKGLFNKRAKAEKFIQTKDGHLIRNEERIRAMELKRNEVSIKKAVLSGEVEGLNKEFERFKEVTLRRGMNLQQIEVEIKESEKLLKNLGNVNLRALEIYEKVSEEYKDLTSKFDTLRLEKEDVLKLIYEIESKKGETFMKTFSLLERNFREIFSSLSTKGEAELVIENPESIFEGGVDIRVKIVGKRYLDIKGLSGGEKTLAALSFIFAIQEFDPSSFYLMDEVDAALDKKNSELLSKLIAKYSNGAQYIVISHNDSIISEADTIYGVSMQEGMSKVVSLKV
jgi:chromosome segregation protein